MKTLEQTARQAIGTLEIAEGACAHHGFVKMIQNSISDLRQALEQPKQEPMAWLYSDAKGRPVLIQSNVAPYKDGTPLYTEPPKRGWVGLTDADIKQGFQESWITQQAFESAVWWAEQKLKELNK